MSSQIIYTSGKKVSYEEFHTKYRYIYIEKATNIPLRLSVPFDKFRRNKKNSALCFYVKNLPANLTPDQSRIAINEIFFNFRDTDYEGDYTTKFIHLSDIVFVKRLPINAKRIIITDHETIRNIEAVMFFEALGSDARAVRYLADYYNYNSKQK